MRDHEYHIKNFIYDKLEEFAKDQDNLDRIATEIIHHVDEWRLKEKNDQINKLKENQINKFIDKCKSEIIRLANLRRKIN